MVRTSSELVPMPLIPLWVALHGLELIYHLRMGPSKFTFILFLFLTCTPSQGEQTSYANHHHSKLKSNHYLEISKMVNPCIHTFIYSANIYGVPLICQLPELKSPRSIFLIITDYFAQLIVRVSVMGILTISYYDCVYPLNFVKYCFIYFEAPLLGAYFLYHPQGQSLLSF